MFCEESLGKIKFKAFPKRVGPRILSLERVDYFGTGEHYWVVEKKESLLAELRWSVLQRALVKEQLTSSKEQYTKSGVQRSPWSVFRKPQFFHTFSVILILSNYRKCMGKSRFSKMWSRTSLHSRFSVLFLWTRKLLFSKRKHQICEFRKK